MTVIYNNSNWKTTSTTKYVLDIIDDEQIELSNKRIDSWLNRLEDEIDDTK